jgi:hypothetical protein
MYSQDPNLRVVLDPPITQIPESAMFLWKFKSLISDGLQLHNVRAKFRENRWSNQKLKWEIQTQTRIHTYMHTYTDTMAI